MSAWSHLQLTRRGGSQEMEGGGPGRAISGQ